MCITVKRATNKRHAKGKATIQIYPVQNGGLRIYSKIENNCERNKKLNFSEEALTKS